MDDAKELLKMAAEIKPVSAILNLALVLRDAFMENQTIEKFKEVYESKATSTLNLDEASRELCPEIDWFVCFSSVNCGRGNAGQSNYGYANSVMERICEERTKQGLPGLAIQWGAIGDVGVIEVTVGSDVAIGGTIPQRINSCLTVLDKFLQQNQPVVSSFVPYQPSETTTRKDLKHNVLSAISNIFGIKDMSAINTETSLGELGMDSLMAIEVKQILERDFDLLLAISELRQLKVKDLKKLEGASEEKKTTITSESKTKPTSGSTSKSNPKLIKTLNISNTICLAAYSFGESVAFEMCLQAERDPEQHAKVRNLIMLDGSPALMSAYTGKRKSYFRSDSVVEDETQALCSYVLHFVDINMMEFRKELLSLPSLADRVKKSVEKIFSTYNNLQ
ncbi:Fatty acid synthase [Araneus ventricosus]|uniref:Fatty acid synthase n=1 Tax=Araneus ventricosus TaxID=182803 RepID=A0A4Y2FDZ9_ARAVE|nr:Fatty acid synthase [Araneus ventricosus]